MAGSGGPRAVRATFAAAIALVGAGVDPPTASAADDPTVALPGTTLTALTVDLDSDGDREIVRLVQRTNQLNHAVDAWEHNGTRWALIGSAPLPRTTEEPEMSPAGSDAVTLLRVEAAGRERVLAFSVGLVPGDPNGATCCLTIWELQPTVDGDVELRLVRRVGGGAQTIQAADLDGDGSDDLVLTEIRYPDTPEDGEQTTTVTVLRSTGTGFEPVFESTEPQLQYGNMTGESDGVAGVDLLFGPTTDGKMHRLAWADDGPQLDETPIDAGGPRGGWVVGVADSLIVLSLEDGVRVLRWDRGRALETVSRLPTLDYPGVALIGDGPDALVAVQSIFAFENGQAPTVTLHDLALRPLGEVGSAPGTAGAWRLVSGSRSGLGPQRNVYPYVGPITGGLPDGRPAHVSSGMLIQPGGSDGYKARAMAWLLGVQPIGFAGPQDAWAVISDGYGGPPGSAYLYLGGVPTGWGRLSVTPWERLLQPDDEVGMASIGLLGAVEVTIDGVTTLMAEPDGFQVEISAPPGSTAMVVDGSVIDEHEVGNQPLLVDIQPPANRQDDVNVALDTMVLVVSPDGRGATREWTGTFVREQPEISVSGSTDAMSLSATLRGRATPGSAVSANGVNIATNDEGRFEASIDSPIWPSRVLVTARDPLGNEVTELVEVVGVVDYRGLPWAAILVGATLVVGGVLYVRTPKRRAAISLPDGDGRLEELELDAVDGTEPGGR